MTEPDEKAFFDPDPNFASHWLIDDPLAQGALKHASVVVLDVLEEAKVDIVDADPDLDLDELPSLWIFPESVRPALSYQRVDQIHLAAVIVGWKLAQPGAPIPPACIAEELALELIRQEAELALEMVDAPTASLDATKGVYELCLHGSISAFFAAQTPADVALSSSYAIDQAGISASDWFQPFYAGQIGCAPHPVYLERPRPRQPTEPRLSVIDPAESPTTEDLDETAFRVLIRTWDADFLDRDEFGQVPVLWLYQVEAPTPEAALSAVMSATPKESVSPRLTPAEASPGLDRDDLARVSVDIQRTGLPQSFKAHASTFHIVGSFEAGELDQHLPELAGHLAAVFPTAVLAQDHEGSLFGVTVYSENHDEAEADFSEAIEDFVESVDLDWDFIGESTCGVGKLEPKELLAEMKSLRRRGQERRSGSTPASG